MGWSPDREGQPLRGAQSHRRLRGVVSGRLVALVAAATLLFTGCALEPSRLKVEEPVVFVEPVHAESDGSGPNGVQPQAQAAPPGVLGGAKQRLDATLKGADGQLTLTAVNLDTKKTLQYGPVKQYVMASTFKVLILVTLLMQRQDDGGLTSEQKSLAEAMITASDNDAASKLYEMAGGAMGVQKVTSKLGMKNTVPAKHWGLSLTTADDQVTFLTLLNKTDGPLKKDSRDLLHRLMNRISDDQDWGIGDAPGNTDLKNGWVPVDTDGNLWQLNSIGTVTTKNNQTVVMAIFSRGWHNYPADTKWLSAAAKEATDILAAG